VLSGTPVWIVEITYTKFTDNRLGFGKKLVWEKDSEKKTQIFETLQKKFADNTISRTV
jgi:uncharacterized protein YhbP (UPF0306 family)